MNGTGYKLLGLAVWRGGKWYLRKRVPRRKLALVGAGGVTAAAGAAVLARRLAG